jgi:hypothetical protein
MKPYFLYIHRFLFFVTLTANIFACKKMIEIAPAQDLITTDAIFTDDKTATSSIVGIYSRMMQNRLFFASGAVTLYTGMTADEFYSSSPNASRDVLSETIYGGLDIFIFTRQMPVLKDCQAQKI